MNELRLTDGRSVLLLGIEPNGRLRVELNDIEQPGFAATFGHEDRNKIADFARVIELFPTDPVLYRRDQYDPRDFAEER